MTCASGRLTSSPRVYGTTQNVQYLLQPSMIETNAVAPSARGSGRRSNFSISGKLTSTTDAAVTPQFGEHLRQAMDRLRAEHEVDERARAR